MKVEVNNLQTIKNYSVANGVTTSYIYKLVKDMKMSAVVIDGVQFIDTAKYPKLPNR